MEQTVAKQSTRKGLNVNIFLSSSKTLTFLASCDFFNSDALIKSKNFPFKSKTNIRINIQLFSFIFKKEAKFFGLINNEKYFKI